MMKRNAGSIWKRAVMTALLMMAAMTVLCTCNMEFKPEERILSIEPSTKHLELKGNHYELEITKAMLKEAGLESVEVIFLKAPKDKLPITHEDLEILDAQGNSGAVKVIAGKKDQRLTLRYSGKEMKLSADVGIEVVYENNYSIKERNLSVRLEGPDSSVDINDIGILINGDGNKALTVTEGALSEITLLGPDKDDSRVIKSDELKARTRILSSEENRKVSSGASRDIEWLYSGEDYDVAFRTTVSYTAQDMLLKVEPSVASVTLAGFSESLDVTNLSQLSAGHEGVTHKVESGVSSFKAVYSITGEKDIPAEAWANIKNEAGSTAVSTGETKDITFSYTDSAGLSAAFTVSVSYEAIVSMPDIDDEPADDGYSVKLGSATVGCEIWYTTDGTEPSRKGVSSKLYTEAFYVAGSGVTVKAIGWKEKWRPSEVRTLVPGTGRLGRPVFDKPDGFTAAGGLTVSISGGEGEIIAWETQSGRSGSGPSPQSVSLDRNDRISAVARKDGFKDSFSVSRSYNVQVLKPEGLIQDIEGGRRVKLSTATAGAGIYYTTNGEVPTSLSTLYTEGGIEFTDASSFELKAVAVKENLTDSDIYEQTVTVARADSPSFNQADGTVKEWSAVGESLTVNSSAGTSLYVDSGSGFAPAESPHSINGIKRNTQIKAYAVKTGMARSEEVSCTLKIKVSKPAIETFTDGEGLTRVRISCLTDAAQIRFTSHNGSGSNPAIPDESSTLYNAGDAGLIVDGAMSYRARAFAPGLEASDPTEPFGVQAKSISPTFSEDGGHVFTGEGSVVIDTSPAGGRIRYRIDSEQQWSSWENAPVTVTLYRNATLYAEANKDHFLNNSLSREYKVRVPAPVPSLEAVLGGADLTFGEISVGGQSSPGTARIVYRTDGAEIVSESAQGVSAYSAAVEIRDDAARVTARAYSNGMEPSETVTVAGLPITKVGKPVISPVGEEFENSIESMTISSVEGSSIVYHVNGVLGYTPENEPNNVSVPSTGSFTDGTTVKAYARKAGFVDSDTEEQVYGFKAARPVITPDSDNPTTLSIMSSTSSAVIMVASGDTESGPDEGSFSSIQGSSYESENGKWVWAFAERDGFRKSDMSKYRVDADRTPPPCISPEPNPGGHENQVTVTISAPEGLDPSKVSLSYRLGDDGNETPIADGGTLTISENGVHLYAWAKQAGKTKSEPVERTYKILAQAPAIGEPEDIIGGKRIRITAPEGVTVYYTTDGTAPGSSSPNSITGGSYEELSLETANTHVIKAISYAAGKLPSTVVSRDVAVEALSAPAFAADAEPWSTSPERYDTAMNVSWSSPGAASYLYCIGTGEPSAEGSSIGVFQTTRIRAKARGMGKADSAISEHEYVFKAQKPIMEHVVDIEGGKRLRITCATGSVKLYYATSGIGVPSTEVPDGGLIEVTDSVTIRTVARKLGSGGTLMDEALFVPSDIAELAVTVPTSSATVTFSPSAGTYGTVQSVSLSSSAAGAIWYTTDGSVPVPGSGTAVRYSGPVAVGVSKTIKAVMVENGKRPSAASIAGYTLKVPALSADDVTFEEAGGGNLTVTVSKPAAADSVKYRRSGDSGWTVYSVPFTAPDGSTCSFVATKTGWTDSDELNKSLSLPKTATPVISVTDIAGGKRLSMTCADLQAVIYYTTNGNEPDQSSPQFHEGGADEFKTAGSTVVKAVAKAAGKSLSVKVSQTITVDKAAKPTFSPAPSGTYTQPLDVTVTHDGGCDVYYATGSSNPGKDNYSKLIGNTITLDSTSHIYAFARQMGKADSDVADSGRYVFASEAPQITEENIPGGKKATITAPGGSGIVRYTTDGQDPDSATPTTVEAGQTREIELKDAGAYTFKAKFFADDGVSDSFVTKKTITVIQLQSPEINVTPAPWEGDKYDDSVTVAFQSPNATGYLYTTGAGEPDTEGNNVIINQSSTIKVKARGMGYADSPIANRTFTLKLQKPTITEKEKIDEGIIYTISCASPSVALYYSTGGGTPNIGVPGNGEVTVTDTTTLKAVARRDGFDDSEIASLSVNIPVSDNVTFNPEGGTYNEEKTVTLSAASGAKIYYTTDNTEPSPNTGTTVFYNSPISVDKSMNIRAIAIEPGKKRSAVQESAYTLKAPKLKESEIEDGKTQITVKAPSGFTVKYKKQGAANWTIYTSPFEKEIGKTYIFILTREGWIDGVEKTKVAELFPYEVVEVEGGTMKMRRGGIDDVDVTLTGFFMGKYEVTQELYEEVMENNEWNFNNKPSSFSDNPASGENQKKRPVETVRWYDAVAFANQLSKKNGFIEYYILGNMQYGGFTTVTINPDANGYRLPTMDEWEYAARGGTLSRGYIYAGGDNPDAVAWYSDNSGGKTHEVGKKAANELGLYDMSGNVYEWCWDKTGGSFSYNRLRGGSWESPDYHIKSSHVGALSIPSEGYNTFGIRLVRSLD